ncbi:MAG TPA: hypothetical protein VFC42_07205 [Methylomirabilota bacterium]|jgi:hypothetical protein|nr:hypothetical protein [Methylomirabilota bacterium]
MARIFLLSPALCSGPRAQLILGERARSDIARRLRTPAGVPIGEIFAFVSGLYFRGKLAYARAFAAPPPRAPGLLVITPGQGLRPPEHRLTARQLRAIGAVRVDVRELRYRRPLRRDLRRLATALDPDCELVLLGSIATGKYLDVLEPILGPRLRVPADFVGLGDMSRGALMLRAVAAGRELTYIAATELATRAPGSGRR